MRRHGIAVVGLACVLGAWAGVHQLFALRSISSGSMRERAPLHVAWRPAQRLPARVEAVVAPPGIQAAAAVVPVITTYAGIDTSGFSGDGAAATAAALSGPQSVAVDTGRNVYIADRHNNRVRKVTPNGIITTVAGNGQTASWDSTNGDGGPATSAAVEVEEIAVDPAGTLYIAGGYGIRKVGADGVIRTVAQGLRGSPAYTGELGGITGLAVDAAGILYAADGSYHRVRRFPPGGAPSSVAGNGSSEASTGDGGPATAASIGTPSDVAIDAQGNLFIASDECACVRKVTTDGLIHTVIGGGRFHGDPLAANIGRISTQGIGVDARGNLFITNASGNALHMVGPSGVHRIVVNAGYATRTNMSRGDGGPAVEGSFWGPSDVAIDASGNVFVSEWQSSRVRKITPVPDLVPPGSVDAFRTLAVHALGSPVDAVAVGDVTGDHRSDVVATTVQLSYLPIPASDYRVWLFVQRPDGTLAPPLQLSYPGVDTSRAGLALVDVDGDRTRDIVFAHGRGLAVLRGAAWGPLFASEVPDAVGRAHEAVVAMDLDRDGRTDLVTSYGTQLTVYRGDGMGGFTRGSTYSVFSPGVDLKAGDTNGDGLPDLVYQGHQRVDVLRQDGTGGFLAPQPLTGFYASYAAFDMGDLDRDGLLDVVHGAHQMSGPLSLYRQDLARFGPRTHLETYSYPFATRIADMDRDGRTDLLVLHVVGTSYQALGYHRAIAADGEAGYEEEAKWLLPGTRHNPNPRGLAVGDIDGDACPDVAVASGPHLVLLKGLECSPPQVGGPLRPDATVSAAGAAAQNLRALPRIRRDDRGPVR